MEFELWRSAVTGRFALDAALYGVDEGRMEWWRRNIEMDPLIGAVVSDEVGGMLRDYEVEGHVIRYMMIPAPASRVFLMTLRKVEEPATDVAGPALALWRRIVELASVYGAMK